jgi:hypothetical protein
MRIKMQWIRVSSVDGLVVYPDQASKGRVYTARPPPLFIFSLIVSSSNCMVNFSAMKLTKKFIAPL